MFRQSQNNDHSSGNGYMWRIIHNFDARTWISIPCEHLPTSHPSDGVLCAKDSRRVLLGTSIDLNCDADLSYPNASQNSIRSPSYPAAAFSAIAGMGERSGKNPLANKCRRSTAQLRS
jgi:hypothetical protein